MPPSKCPAVETLARFVMGQSADDESEVIEQHLLGCEECLVRTREVRQADTLMDAIRQSGPAIAEPSENAALSGVIERLRGQIAASSNPTVMSREDTRDIQLSASGDQDILSLLGPAESADELGRLGEFRVLKLLGVGGMGVVFLAEDTQLQRLVALKTLKPEFAAGKDATGRFLREARAAAAIKHEHVVTIYQVGEALVERPSGAVSIPFLAQELLEGESLDDRLRRESPLPVGDVLRIGREIAEGLAAAHAKGLIHRDIKPANVWLERSRHAPRDEPTALSTANEQSTSHDQATLVGQSAHHAERDGYVEHNDSARVKLLDFGLARSAEGESQITSAGMIVGTPSYMAPEQASGETLDARADLFSLGVVLYRMTTGQLPFPGKKLMEILKALVTFTPAAPQSLNPAVPRELSDLIERLLAKDRDARPASAREVAKALGGIAKQSSEPGGVSPRTDQDTAQVRELTLPGSPPLQVRRLTPPGSPKYRAVALGAVSAVLLLGAVLFVQTRGGSLKIEAGDGIDASVVKEQVTIRDTVSGKTYEVSMGENSMRPGQYEIVLRDPASGLKVSTERVEIQRGNSTPLRITLQPKPVTEPEPKLVTVPSSAPLDKLEPANIPDSEKFSWQPKELVAVLGTHAWRHWGPVLSVSSNPDGSLIASAGEFDGVRLWEGATGKQVGSWPGSAVSFSADGERLVIRGETELVIVDVPSREIRAKFKTSAYPSMMAISSDANTLAVVTGESVQVFDVVANKQSLSLPFTDFTKDIRGIALSADGKTLAAACVEGLKLWDVATGQSLPAPDVKNVPCVIFSPDGKALATQAENGKIQIWNLATQRVEAEFEKTPGHSSKCIAFSPDGKTLATGVTRSAVWIWNVSSGQTKEFSEPQWAVNSVAFSADGRIIVSGGLDAAVRLCNTPTAKQTNTIQGFPSQASLLALAPNDRVLAVAGPAEFGRGRVVLWDVIAGREQNSWLADAQIHGLAIGLDAKTVATAGYSEVRLWDLPSGERQPPLEENSHATAVLFGSDKKSVSAISATSQGNEIRTWDILTGKMKSSFRIAELNLYATWLAQSPDGTQFVYCDRDLHAWDATTQTKRWTVSQTEGGFVSPVFSRDGKKLLVVKTGDVTPTVYDAATGQLVEAYLGGHPDPRKPPTCAIFLPDDKTIISAGYDGQIIEWTSPRQRRVLCHLPGPVLNLKLAADGRHLFTANSNGTVYVLRLSERLPSP